MFIGEQARHPHGRCGCLGSWAEQSLTIAVNRGTHAFRFGFFLIADSTMKSLEREQERDRSHGKRCGKDKAGQRRELLVDEDDRSDRTPTTP